MEKPVNETDSLPRIQVRDMFMLLRLFERTDQTTLENFRLRLCTDRKSQRRGDYLFSTARDTASELQKLGVLKGGPFPKDSRDYVRMCNNALSITKSGRALLSLFAADRGAAYDDLFGRMYAAHRHLRDYAAILSTRPVFVPVLTSVKDHISPAYTNAVALADDLSRGDFRVEEMLASLTQRLKRALSDSERKEIEDGARSLVVETRLSAASEDATEFAKKVIDKLNFIVVPAVLREAGLNCDYRTHRAAWSIGQEFLVWCATTSHPDHQGTLVFGTRDVGGFQKWIAAGCTALQVALRRPRGRLPAPSLGRLYSAPKSRGGHLCSGLAAAGRILFREFLSALGIQYSLCSAIRSR